jgi:hypothetical protein
MPTLDVCYGPITPGQFFIEELNPESPVVYKATGVLNEGVMICEKWGMNEDGWVWSFGLRPGERGWQVSISNLENMQRVSCHKARLFCEQNLRRRDDQWHANWDPEYKQAAVKIVRCTCGVGDDAERTRHTLGCFMRGEFL